jgi:hypothetical protein
MNKGESIANLVRISMGLIRVPPESRARSLNGPRRPVVSRGQILRPGIRTTSPSLGADGGSG